MDAPPDSVLSKTRFHIGVDRVQHGVEFDDVGKCRKLAAEIARGLALIGPVLEAAVIPAGKLDASGPHCVAQRPENRDEFGRRRGDDLLEVAAESSRHRASRHDRLGAVGDPKPNGRSQTRHKQEAHNAEHEREQPALVLRLDRGEQG